MSSEMSGSFKKSGQMSGSFEIWGKMSGSFEMSSEMSGSFEIINICEPWQRHELMSQVANLYFLISVLLHSRKK